MYGKTLHAECFVAMFDTSCKNGVGFYFREIRTPGGLVGNGWTRWVLQKSDKLEERERAHVE